MLLCTDVGNTNIKFALYVNEKQIVKLRFATDPKKTDDELAVELYTIFNINNIENRQSRDLRLRYCCDVRGR